MSADFVRHFWSEEDRCYVADLPELFPCAAYGDTAEEALELLGVVMARPQRVAGSSVRLTRALQTGRSSLGRSRQWPARPGFDVLGFEPSN